jgi:hypothetical protein
MFSHYIPASMIRLLGVLAVAVALATAGRAQNDVDKALKTDYDAAMEILKKMDGDATDDAKREVIVSFQNAIRALVDKFAPKSGELTVGHFDLARSYFHIVDPE